MANTAQVSNTKTWLGLKWGRKYRLPPFSPHNHAGAPGLGSAAELDHVMALLQDAVIPALRLAEYYVADEPREILSFYEHLASLEGEWPAAYADRPVALSGPATSLVQTRWEPARARFSLSLDVEATADAILRHLAATQSALPWTAVAATARHVCGEGLHAHVVELEERTRGDIAAALAAIRNSVYYERLDPAGPRLGPVSRSHPLIKSCFARLGGWWLSESATPDSARGPVNLADIDLHRVMVHNGWVWGGDCSDFASPSSRA
jgi:glycogen debranching enzyme